MIIYKTTNLITGEYYIGKDSNNNPNYYGSGKIYKRAEKKYGKQNFKKEILEVCLSEWELNEAEKKWVTQNVVNDPMSYNLVLGGSGGNLYTHEQKIENGICEKISKAHLGKKLSDEHVEKIKRGQDPYRSKQEPKKHKQPNKVHYGKDNHFFGKKHNGDMSRFGKHRKGIPPTNAKAVLCIDTGVVYASSHEASLSFPNPNTARRAIADVCKGRREKFMNKKYKYV